MSVEVLLDDFENKDKWEVAGEAATHTHVTTFKEGAPTKEPGVYADGVAGEDVRALALLVRKATDRTEIELAAKPGQAFTVKGDTTGLDLWVRSPHAAIQVSAQLQGEDGTQQEVQLGKLTADRDWHRAGTALPQPLSNATLTGLKIRVTEVVKHEGEVMILLDDLTVRTAG
ncbi:hypothetical protein H0264_31290 [Nocardia huaxiensis]|uniref:Uncharacterized protein n=1 Tax=Nocardia huaxiensis TaxID=2755382 RepID=A0A7D6ZBH8_9NOCA|nr:hypothetical protein [Nocardia huaxiensis]QLY29678.1 hypothetical protein H0264_31290 [Nocardia huaxiensis]